MNSTRRKWVVKKLFAYPNALLLLLILYNLSFLYPHDVTADSYPPLPEALAALESDEEVTVTQVIVSEWSLDSNFYYTFEPNSVTPTIGFIIYPGAYIDPRSYAPAAHAIAAQGYLTVIVKMVQDLAILSYTRAERVISDHPDIEEWTIGGHSLGGPSVCAYIRESNDIIDGVVMWASYPSEGFRVDDKIIKALSIYGTKDGLVTPDEIETSRLHLPPYTQWEEITGGNHTQFGWYDTSPYPVQPEDNPADITRQQQQDIIIQATVDFLNHFELCPNDPENDYDNDIVCGDSDNCPTIPNGPNLGTCVNCGDGTIGPSCTDDGQCTSGYCNMDQNDIDNDGLGDLCDDSFPPGGNGCIDACDCEGDFDRDGDGDASDAIKFKQDFGRKPPTNPCTATNPCNGDFDCDGNVDASDAILFKQDFGRRDCPSCAGGEWCGY